jgi:hypothetical protein
LGEEPALKKRVCENCRFFQEAGFAKNGWCNNPQRKETSDVKLVVRRNELACRNGWAQDLFSDRTDEGEPSDIVLHDTIAVRPLPPASVEELTFLVNSQRDKPSATDPPPALLAVDVVVGEAPSTKPATERASLLAQDPRSAILKARERYRARQAADLRQGGAPRLFDDRVVGSGEASEPIAPISPIRPEVARPLASPRQPRVGDVAPVQISELPRNFPTITSFPEDEIKFSSVPEPVEGIALPRPVPKVHVSSRATTDPATDDAPVAWDDKSSHATTFDDAARVEQLSIEEHPLRDRPQPSHDVKAWPEEPLAADPTEGVLPERSVGAPRPDRRRFELGGRRRANRGIAVAMEAVPVLSDQDVWIDDSGVPPMIDDLIADVDPTITISPDVPRMCRTCRDFRPADSGERGWCTNKWAFSHRRMVDADELPCETSVGCWWLPHDDVWLETADVSAHGQPTPLVDLWLAHKDGSATADAGDQRRRQRS